MDRLTAKFVGSEQQAQWDCTEIKCDNCGGAFDYSILRASSWHLLYFLLSILYGLQVLSKHNKLFICVRCKEVPL